MDIEASFQSALDRFVAFLPNLIGFLVLLLVGFIIARLVALALRKLLEKAALDDHLARSTSGDYIARVAPQTRPSHLIARLVFWVIFALFVVAAIGVLGIDAVSDFMNRLLAYLPNVLAAILILIVAVLLAGVASAAIGRLMGDNPTGRIVATVVPALIMVIALFMVLEQLQIAAEIVRIAFAATMGAIALGLALAFGLGGRPVAERMLENAYRKRQEEDVLGRRRTQTGVSETGTHAAGAPYGASGTYREPGTAQST